MRVLLVGNRGETNIGTCFERAACDLGVETRLLEIKAAMGSSVWLRRLNWYLRGKRPTWLGWFGRHVVEACRTWRPSYLVATGIAPLDWHTLAGLKALGVRTVNYLTDDPWNPCHRAPWFLAALPGYDAVFSPRRANLADLRGAGCAETHYLPFAYDPELFYRETQASDAERARFDSDVAFVGTGDADRVPYLAALIQAGVSIGLHGMYWDRYPQTRGCSHGQANVRTARLAVTFGRVSLCLVRRANRDGHCMRTYEVPAVGSPMVAEDTVEHREILGAEGEAVLYFRTIDEMVAKVRWLLDRPEERDRLAAAAHRRIVGGANTYRDRLARMLGLHPETHAPRQAKAVECNMLGKPPAGCPGRHPAGENL